MTTGRVSKTADKAQHQICAHLKKSIGKSCTRICERRVVRNNAVIVKPLILMQIGRMVVKMDVFQLRFCLGQVEAQRVNKGLEE